MPFSLFDLDDKVIDQPPTSSTSSTNPTDQPPARIMHRPSVRGSVYLEDAYQLGYMDDSSEEEEEPQVHKGWLKMNPIAERKSE